MRRSSATPSARARTVQVRAHELGHNWGMLHSNSFLPSVRGPLDTASFAEYGDYSCIMGSGGTAYNAAQRLTSGWLTSDDRFAAPSIFPNAPLNRTPPSNRAVCTVAGLDSMPREHTARFALRALSFAPTVHLSTAVVH